MQSKLSYTQYCHCSSERTSIALASSVRTTASLSHLSHQIDPERKFGTEPGSKAIARALPMESIEAVLEADSTLHAGSLRGQGAPGRGTGFGDEGSGMVARGVPSPTRRRTWPHSGGAGVIARPASGEKLQEVAMGSAPWPNHITLIFDGS